MKTRIHRSFVVQAPMQLLVNLLRSLRPRIAELPCALTHFDASRVIPNCCWCDQTLELGCLLLENLTMHCRVRSWYFAPLLMWSWPQLAAYYSLGLREGNGATICWVIWQQPRPAVTLTVENSWSRVSYQPVAQLRGVYSCCARHRHLGVSAHA